MLCVSPSRLRAAYTLEEVDQKTREFRKAMTTPRPVAEDASEFEVVSS